MKFKFKHILFLLLSIVVTTLVIDFIRIFSYKTHLRKPKKDIQSDQSQIYRDLLDGKTDIDWDGLDGTLEYINGQYDCANFRMVI